MKCLPPSLMNWSGDRAVTTEKQMLKGVARAIEKVLDAAIDKAIESNVFPEIKSDDLAKAAIAAMEPFVREMVEGLKYTDNKIYMLERADINPKWLYEINKIRMSVDKALASLPACWKVGE